MRQLNKAQIRTLLTMNVGVDVLGPQASVVEVGQNGGEAGFLRDPL